MLYAQKIEKQRQRYYSGARSIMRKALRSYTDALMIEVNKATTPQQIITASEKPIQSDKIHAAMRKLYGNTLPFFANQTVRQLKPKKAIAPDPIETDYWQEYIDKFVKMRLADRIKLVGETTADVFQSTARKVVDEAIREGWGVDTIAKNLMKELNISERYRAERIARTEVVSASNEGSLAGANSTGLDMVKEWISYIDDKTRDSHRNIPQGVGGESVEIDGIFSNGLQYPGDPSGLGEEVINCRCTIGYKIKDSNFEIGRTINE